MGVDSDAVASRVSSRRRGAFSRAVLVCALLLTGLAVSSPAPAGASEVSSAGMPLGTRVAFRDFLASPKGRRAVAKAGLASYYARVVAAAKRGDFRPKLVITSVSGLEADWYLTVTRTRLRVLGVAKLQQLTVNSDNSQDAVFERVDRFVETALRLYATRTPDGYRLVVEPQTNVFLKRVVVTIPVHVDAYDPADCGGGQCVFACLADSSIPCLLPLPAR
jgi:hypothetical protein